MKARKLSIVVLTFAAFLSACKKSEISCDSNTVKSLISQIIKGLLVDTAYGKTPFSPDRSTVEVSDVRIVNEDLNGITCGAKITANYGLSDYFTELRETDSEGFQSIISNNNLVGKFETPIVTAVKYIVQETTDGEIYVEFLP